MDSNQFLEQLKQRFTKVTFEQKETEHELDILIVTDQSKSFNFYIWIEGGWTTMDIGATLKDEPNKDFWYSSFEHIKEDDPTWIPELMEIAFDELGKILDHETRIIQRKGFLSTSFECQQLTSSWNRVSKNRFFHTNFELPEINGRRKTYN